MANVPTACAGCGEPEPTTGSYFVSAYPPFDHWTERRLPAFLAALGRSGSPEVPLGLYVHIPFCEQRCDYCYYLSYDDRGNEIDAYLDSLTGELALYADARRLAGRNFDFAYIGGGTPSLLSSSRLERLFGALSGLMDLNATRELTFECAPCSVTAEKLRLLRRCGVTRISMGIQALDDRVLRANRRLHLVADIERAVEAIQSVGFEVLNLDLIVGLRGESDETFFRGLKRTLAFEPESLTIYQLEIPHNTPLFRDLDQQSAPGLPGLPDIPDWETKRRRLSRAYDTLENAGYTLRSAYTAVRDPERHAFLYQDLQYDGADLVGAGASSFSYLDGVHQQNLASLGRYLAPRDSGELPLGRAYDLSVDEQLVRQVVLQLKLGRLDLAALGRRFGIDVRARFGSALGALEHEGYIGVTDQAAHVTRQGLLRIDRLLPRFYLAEHREPAGQGNLS